MLASVASLAAFGAVADEPIVVNGGFESDGAGKVAGWREQGKYSFRPGEGINGTGAFYYENNDPGSYCVPGQPIKLTPGRRYRFSVWARTENIVGDESGASICIEWSGADGKWMGGAYAGGVKGTRFWTKVESMTATIPEGARSFRVCAYVRKGMTGKAWFDDICVVPVEPKVVAGVCSTAYRNMAADGDVTFRAFLEEGAVKPGRLVFRHVGADGRLRFTEMDGEGNCTMPVKSLRMGRQKVGVAAYGEDGGVLGAAETAFTRVERLPKMSVWFDGQGRAIVDGKPFFPLGMYWGAITTNKLEIYAKGPFNCLMPYNAPNSKELMDLCHERGLKVMDTSAFQMCLDQKIPCIRIFNMDDLDNILRVARGEAIGTVVHM